jgi:DNA-binding transcriptional MerR regulator
MKIGDASRASGASARSLRHYEDEGLIVPGRFDNGFRDYCQSTIDRVLVIRSLLESGLPVRLIREALPSLADGTDVESVESVESAERAEFLDEVQAHRDRLAARIAVLSDQQAALDAYLRDAGRTGSLPPLPPLDLDLDTSVRILGSAHGERRAAVRR